MEGVANLSAMEIDPAESKSSGGYALESSKAWFARGGGERPVSAGRHYAQLRALKDGRAWPNADFGGTGTDSGCEGMRPGCVPDASGF